MRRILLPLCLALGLVACQAGKPAALREAESLLPERPDSALVVLDGVCRDNLATDRARAEYDYLEALDRKSVV